MRNVSEKLCIENQNTYFMFNFFFLENRAGYEITWKKILELGRPQMAIWRMGIAYWIAKVTNTHSEFVTLIVLTLQKLSQGHSTLLRSYVHCLSCSV